MNTKIKVLELSDDVKKIVNDIDKQIKEFNLPISVLRSDIIQGFLIEDNRDIRFVNRSEGAEIAKALGYKIQHSDCLYSEDLW